jgi:enoyl-CoA hydratase/carnithine racemase
VDKFKAMLDCLEDDKPVRAIVLISRKPDNFIVGAGIA